MIEHFPRELSLLLSIKVVIKLSKKDIKSLMSSTTMSKNLEESKIKKVHYEIEKQKK